MHRLVLAGFLSVLFAAASGAQNSSILTETEFLSVLSETHPAVLEDVAALDLARARVLEAKTFENPVLDLVREELDGTSRQTDLLASWQLPNGARRAKVEALLAMVDAETIRVAQRRLAKRLEMRAAYAEWSLGEARTQLLSHHARRIEALAARQTARFERGEASGLESRRLRLAVSELRSKIALSSAVSERARGAVLSWYPEMPADAIPELPWPLPIPKMAGPSSRVLAAEADLLAARLDRQAAGRFLKSPEVSIGWQRQEVGGDSRDSVSGPIVGLSWSLPLFDRNRAKVEAAEANIDAAQARLELEQRVSSVSRVATQEIFDRLFIALDPAQQELSESDRLLDGVEAAFGVGEASLTDLLEAHRSVTEAHLTALDLREAVLAAHRDLERLAGSASTGALPARDEESENRPIQEDFP